MRFLIIFFAFLFSLFAIHYSLITNSYAHSQTQVIEMTPSGFVPADVTVDENSAVIFVNKDTQARWPASNIHPTHEIYSEFDPKKPIERGDSWSFKPKRVGTWKYHDHLFPHMRGTIKVKSDPSTSLGTGKLEVGSKNIVSKIFEGIKLWLQEFMDKFSAAFAQTKKEDAAKKWEELKQKYKGEAGSSGDIHDQAHLAGNLIFSQRGFDGIASCSPEFAFGCFHGFLDTAFAKNLDHLADAHSACRKLEGSNALTGPVASCIHGIGHGVASFYGTNDLKASLSTCGKLESGGEYCFDGVFMEFVRGAPQSFFKKNDPLYPCNELEQTFGTTYSSACGRNQPSLLMGRFSMGFDEVIGVCNASRSVPFKKSCFDSLGFSLAATGDANQIITGCQKISVAEFISTCIKSAAGELIFQEVPGWENKWEAVCNGDSARQECLENGLRLIREYKRVAKVSVDTFVDGEDPDVYIRNQLKRCFGSQGRDDCYRRVAEVLHSSFGLKKTLQLLSDNEGYEEVYARCHEVTHYLSRNEYEKLGDISRVYAQCDSTCHGGCYHGTLEAYLKKQQDGSGFSLTNHFPAVCGKLGDYQKPLEYYECLHGMGHAAMFVTDMELKESLALCDTFEDQGSKDRCYSGVFMENSSSSTSFDHASVYIKADDPFYPCNSLDEKYQSLCWQYQSSYFSIISSQDWKKVANLCLQIPQKYQHSCFRTIGTNQVGFTRDPGVMKQNCEQMPGDFRDICVLGVVSSLAYRFVGDTDKMIQFCSMVNDSHKQTCFKQIGSGLLDWSTDKNLTKTQCGKIPDPKGSSWCMSVI